ncbi:uncharacterized protein DMAD_04714 [Drosophila madeirensis]|uniref:Uncharacterized protein n=1 Tax=Drosophila madeirensis TaxID=30013 RepID=A0AAU9GEZ7_DROMD
MSAKETEPFDEGIEAAFKRHSQVVPEVKKAYHEAIAQVFADLSPDDLAPFAAIQSEHGDTYLDTDELAGAMRSKMTNILGKLNQHFFDGGDVDVKLVELEMLKEKFAPYEGHNWNVNHMSPEEYTRPVRMRLLDSSIRVLERELAAQDRALAVAEARIEVSREHLQSMQNERARTTAAVEKQIVHYTEMEPTLLQLEQSINNSFLPPDFDPL